MQMNVYELINYLIDHKDKTDEVCIYNYRNGNRTPLNINAIDDGVRGCLDIGYNEDED